MQAFDTNNPATHNYLSAMADEVHFYGAKLILCCGLEMPDGYTMNGGFRMGPPGTPRGETKPLPKEMMQQVIDRFVQKVQMYRTCGYDGITMRVDMDLCPQPNERQDEYGGSVENRTRLVLDAYRAVKKAFGPGFLTEAEIAGEQPMGYMGDSAIGYTLEDAIQFARLAQGCVDILQLRERDMAISHPTGYTFQRGEHATIRYSQAIKAAGVTHILTEPVGGFFYPDEVNEYIASGACDLIGMGRALISNPKYMECVQSGHPEKLTPCIWCNKCHGTILPKGKQDPWISTCSVNPEMGLQHKLPRLLGEKPQESKKVAIIGGGPAGMEAALVAASRGHQVTLFEKSARLGGQLHAAGTPKFKWPVADFRDWLVASVTANPAITVVLHTAPDPEDLKAQDFDAVLAATGAVPAVPASIQGLREETGEVKNSVLTCYQVLEEDLGSELGQNVVICGASETGIETGMYLAQMGKDVTLLTRQEEIGHDCSKLHYVTMSWVKPHGDGTGHLAPDWEKYENLTGITQVTTKQVDGNTVTYQDKEGKEHTITADNVLICGGVTNQVEEALRYAGTANLFYVIGDANGMGNIQKCMRDAYSKALQI
jgi:2,4-dienoyl-CoA reductase-like NADH-dependent reductase (Old Yellow Enzyme family)/thioredoxin reductase